MLWRDWQELAALDSILTTKMEELEQIVSSEKHRYLLF